MGCPVPVFSDGGLLIPPNLPHVFFVEGEGGSRAPAVVAGPSGLRPRPQRPTAMPPELPAPPWPPNYLEAPVL